MTFFEVLQAAAAASAIINDCIQNYRLFTESRPAQKVLTQAPKPAYRKPWVFTWTVRVEVG